MKKVVPILLLLGVVLISVSLIFKVFFMAGVKKDSEKPIENLVLSQMQNPQPQPQILQNETSEQNQNSEPESMAEPPPIIFGIYEVCSEITDCNPEQGLSKIKAAGAKAVIITVVDEENLRSLAYYPSGYLPMAEDIPEDYLKRIVELAHKNAMRVYVLLNIPHNHWLKDHPDWLAVWSDGQPADVYESDYFHRIVPPSRIIAEQECLALLGNIIAELINYDIDGIDINDNFQFSDQYVEQSETTLFSSFDDFTVRKFERDNDVVIPEASPAARAAYIKNNSVLYQKWLAWRADQIVQLFKILKQSAENTGADIPLRPHLLTYGEPFEYYGLDYRRIAGTINFLYLMITPDFSREKYFELIKSAKDAGAQKVIASTYLFEEAHWDIPERDEEKISKRIQWLKQAGAAEIYLYNFNLIEEANLWPAIKRIFDKVFADD